MNILGESSTKKSRAHSFDVDGKTFCFIDTPGIADTDGSESEQSNIRDILTILESVDKLSAILILMRPDETRKTTLFQYCLSEILSRLHVDAKKNIMFGFTNASVTFFRPGAVKGILDNRLESIEAGIARGDANEFFFDSKAFMYLAACKTSNVWMPGGQGSYTDLWRRSADSLHRLLETVMSLQAHEVRKTLALGRTALSLESMAKPLAAFIDIARTNKEALEDEKSRLKEARETGDKLQSVLDEPLRKLMTLRRQDFPYPRTVCSHVDCTSQVTDQNTRETKTVYNTICHAPCDIKVTEGIPGEEGLKRCRPFNRWMRLLSGYECENQECGHSWKDHMHMKYALVNDEFDHPDDVASPRAAEHDVATLEGKMKSLNDRIEKLEATIMAMDEETTQISTTRALFYVYLSKNSIGNTKVHRDATTEYLNLQIRDAMINGRSAEEFKLREEMKHHLARIEELQAAINNGSLETHDDKAIEERKTKLINMALFGPHIEKVIRPDLEKCGDDNDNAERFLFADSKTVSRPAWF